MTDKTFTFTVDQIKDIFKAGIDRGSDEAGAFEWGSSASGNKFDNCVEAVHDIINAGKKWGEDGYVEYAVIEAMFKDK